LKKPSCQDSAAAERQQQQQKQLLLLFWNILLDAIDVFLPGMLIDSGMEWFN